ncbi:Signal peptidase I [Actinokineospora spheciospongiae]|uniref:Signal peptidase I n=1 Tax=Actinokineospora spheciospongiae TaxID=909613 RepID=W7J130_9PSEU|nr:signal peptidase I [Actinokineospora spheciospongiae]EWC62611.1 Signal peptidase I [Actinokineospora spheciospongiae]PWW54240.1 signal peptidase I [Actinokineospora spheciospongiae]
MPDGPDTPDDPETTDDDGGSGADRPARAKKKLSFWVELPILVAIALVLTFLVQSFVARVFVIPSESMEATLHGCPGCTGDRVVVDRVVYYFRDPGPGDVVVFERPGTWNRSEFTADRSDNAVVRLLQDVGSVFGLATPDEDDVVKRVVAVGGQTVQCCDDRNRVTVDGAPLDEPYIHYDPEVGPTGQERFDPVSVPQGMLFVMGDNRNNSGDSRTQGGGGANGLVPVDNVIGKARAIILPPSRWRGVGDHDPQALSAPAWQSGIPAGVGLAAAWPVLWLGRRASALLRPAARRESDRAPEVTP